jgi:RHS repeat-associated protein
MTCALATQSLLGLSGLVSANAAYWETAIFPVSAGSITGPDGCSLAIQQRVSLQGTPISVDGCVPNYRDDGPLVGMTAYLWYGGTDPDGNRIHYPGTASLVCEAGEVRRLEGCVRVEDERRRRAQEDASSCRQGNPVVVLTGSKRQDWADFSTEGSFPLEFKRYYRSSVSVAVPGGDKSAMGFRWSSNFDARAFFRAGYDRLSFQLPDGTDYHFQKSGTIQVPTTLDLTGAVFPVTFTTSTTGNRGMATVFSDRVEFSPDGNITYVFNSTINNSYWQSPKLTLIRYRGGYTQTLSYNTAGQLATVTDSFGRTLQFAYDAFGYISQMTVPGGQVYKYIYRTTVNSTALQQQYPSTNIAAYQNARNVLEKVILPDATAATDTDNPSLLYHYENATDSALLTGLTDQRGIRYATWTYGTDGRATSSQHAGGNDLNTFSFDDANSRVTFTNPLGKQAVFNFSLMNGATRRLSSIQGQVSPNCPAANQNFTYDANSFLASVTDGEGRITTYVNDARGRPTSMTRGSGAGSVTTTMAWNATWDVPTQVVQPGLTEDFAYDPTGKLTSTTQTSTTTQTVPYSTSGQTRVWTYGYTGLLLTSVNGPLAGTGDTVSYAYNAQGYLTSVTNEVGHITTINTVNGRGQPTRMTDPNGLITDFAYNERGELTTVTVSPTASPRVTTLTRDASGQITQVAAPGVTLTFTYDNARRMTRMANAASHSVEYTYDVMGNVTKTTSKSGTTVLAERNATFDELGRIIRSIGAGGTAGGRVWAFGYDKADNLTSMTDPRSQVFGQGFDALNRLVSTTNPGPATVQMTLNGKDEITTYRDPRNFDTIYTRNGFGEVIRRASPDTGITDYVYDTRGLITQMTDARGFVTTFTYDNAGRRLTKSFTGATAENVTYTYDNVVSGNAGRGRLTRVVDQAGSSDFIYNIHGNVTRETRIIGTRTYAVSYGYNTGNLLTSITYPSGRVVTYARNNTGRVTGVTTRETSTASNVNLATSIVWRGLGGSGIAGTYGQASPMAAPLLPISETTGLAANDNSARFPGARLLPPPVSFGADGAQVGGVLLQSLTFGNGLTHTRSYSTDDLINQLIVADPATTPATNRILRTHGYGDNLSLTQITDGITASENQSFWLNVAGRLQNADGPWGQDVYQHDGVGNRTQVARTVAGVTTTRVFAYGATNNRLNSVLNGAVTERTLTHDAAGNITGDNQGTGANFTHTINRAGRISASARGGVAQGAYAYDAFERLRVRTLTNQSVSTNNGTTHYVWDIFGNIIAEADGATGGSLRETVYLEGALPIAAIAASAASPKPIYQVHTDHLNRPIMLTNAAKVNVWWASYEPFGRVRATGGAVTQNLELPGQWFQLETGLAYNWHRHYDPSTGRYTTPDPLGFVDGPSVFTYAGSNPQRVTDSNGLFRFDRSRTYNDSNLFCEVGRRTGKERANDLPSRFEGARPNVGENGRTFAERILREMGQEPGTYGTGPTSDFNQLKKFGDRYGR